MIFKKNLLVLIRYNMHMFYHSDHNQIYGLHAKKFEKKIFLIKIGKTNPKKYGLTTAAI